MKTRDTLRHLIAVCWSDAREIERERVLERSVGRLLGAETGETISSAASTAPHPSTYFPVAEV